MTKKTKKEKSAKQSVKKALHFTCYGKSSPLAEEEFCGKFAIEKGIEKLTYDEVENEALERLLQKFPENYYPASEVSRLTVEDEDGVECPVAPETEKDIAKKYPKQKVLVLPHARYALTDESLLWMALRNEGYVGEDDEMDLASMKNILNYMRDYHERLEKSLSEEA